MVSTNFIERGLQNPIFSMKTAISYLLQRNDIEYIRKSLYTYYNKNEFDRFAIGASAGIKEIAIYLIIKRYRPSLIVETGVANGVSTYFILKAMHENKRGKLISIDYPNYNKNGYVNEDGKPDAVFIPAGKEPGWIVPINLRDRFSVMIGKSADILPKLDIIPDIFYHDSDHSYTNMKFELEWAYEHVKDGGIIMADDTNTNSAWDEFIVEKELKRLRLPISAAIK